MGSLRYTLHDEDFSTLHQCGVAGMALTLKALERDSSNDEHAQRASDLLEWQVDQTSLELTWSEDTTAHDALMSLLEYAWQTRNQTDNDDGGLGIFYVPGLHLDSGEYSLENRLTFHQGLFATLLQHPRIQPRTAPRSPTQMLDETNHLHLRYVEPKNLIRHIEGARKDLFDGKGRFKKKARKLSNYLYPGATGRTASEVSVSSMADRAYPLFFTPIAAFLTRLRPGYSEWVVVVPQIRELLTYVQLRHEETLKPLDMYHSGSTDAALGILSSLHRSIQDISTFSVESGPPAGVEVYQLGEVAWNRQTVRNNFVSITPHGQVLKAYEVILRALPNQLVAREEKSSFVSVPMARGRIVDNLIRGSYWYEDLFFVTRSIRQEIERLSKPGESLNNTWARQLFFSKTALRTIMANMPEQGDEEAFDRVFVEVFHKSLNMLYGKEASRAKEGSRTPQDRIEDRRDGLRRALMRSQTRSMLREVLSEFFAEAGQHTRLGEERQLIWRYLDDPRRWKRARDLALLSIVTYQGTSSLRETETNQEEGEETS